MVSSAASLPTLRAVEPKAGYRLTVTWDRGAPRTIDFLDTIQKGGVFAALEDEKLFTKVRMSSDRRKIEWPEPRDDYGEPLIDIDAESLMVIARAQGNAVNLNRLGNAVRTLQKVLSKTGSTDDPLKANQSKVS